MRYPQKTANFVCLPFTPGVELKAALRDNSYESVRKTEEAGKDKKKKEKKEEGNGPVPDTV